MPESMKQVRQTNAPAKTATLRARPRPTDIPTRVLSVHAVRSKRSGFRQVVTASQTWSAAIPQMHAGPNARETMLPVVAGL